MSRYAVKSVGLILLILLLLGTAAGSQADHYLNSSEPAFLKDIGPQDERADNPIAAAVTAIAITAVFYRGFRKYGNTSKQAER